MATWDAADLLQRFNDFAHRPATDAAMGPEMIYRFLSTGQTKVYDVFAVHVPQVLYGAPAKLTTSDGGYTYVFPSSIYPMGAVEIRDSRTGPLLLPGTDWDAWADFVHEGNQIRIPNGKTRTFTDGPYARFITPPGVVSAASEPTLKPDAARILIVYYALYVWSHRVGIEAKANDFLGLYQNELTGDPRIKGDVGILGMLKTQFYGDGASAGPPSGGWWRSPDLG